MEGVPFVVSCGGAFRNIRRVAPERSMSPRADLEASPRAPDVSRRRR
ncbi:hypothetical protein HMPREF9582_02554 [Cutibacterium acnes HL060PA1]|nr:hypothetical protein HMPREF9582_02554 [Cutibacterium acnes HL060PA1]